MTDDIQQAQPRQCVARAAGPQVPETDREAALRKFFAEQEIKSIDNLEAAARQIIQLVTALLGVLFGVLALSNGDAAASLQRPLVFLSGLVAVILLLAAIPAALAVVLPGRSSPRDNVPADEARAFKTLMTRKRHGLNGAVVLFGGGLVAFAIMVGTMIVLRYGG